MVSDYIFRLMIEVVWVCECGEILVKVVIMIYDVIMFECCLEDVV